MFRSASRSSGFPSSSRSDGMLRGTILLQDVQQRMKFRMTLPPGTPGDRALRMPAAVRCAPSAASTRSPPAPFGPPVQPSLPEPLPGPTLRARVGDIVELTFVNQLDPNKFGATHDTGAKAPCRAATRSPATRHPGYPYK